MSELRNVLITVGGVISLTGICMLWLGTLAEWSGNRNDRVAFFKVGIALIIIGTPLVITAINIEASHD